MRHFSNYLGDPAGHFICSHLSQPYPLYSQVKSFNGWMYSRRTFGEVYYAKPKQSSFILNMSTDCETVGIFHFAGTNLFDISRNDDKSIITYREGDE
jgi:hypothetical protein